MPIPPVPVSLIAYKPVIFSRRSGYRSPSTLIFDLRRGGIDFPPDSGGSTPLRCFLQTAHLRRTRDRNNPRLLREQPSECDLSRSRFLPLRDAAEQVNQCLVRLKRLFAFLHCFSLVYTKLFVQCLAAGLVMLPSNSPVFLRVSRLHDQLFAR
jgi:hypothetical protein